MTAVESAMDPAADEPAEALFESNLHSLPLIARGKVRDNYAVGTDRILMVASDRISAFDVVMNEAIPGKGKVLTSMALFWFDKLAHIVPNHLTGVDPESVVADDEKALVRGRSMLVRRLKPLPVEAVVRGYLAGSAWKEYEATGSVCGVMLPPGLKNASKLPAPIFTPATKAAMGDHDENIDFERMSEIVGADVAKQMRDVSIRLYSEAAAFALTKGIIIADTKFEFGVDEEERLTLMDEVLTPDSSRFWPVQGHREGANPVSYDKQGVRDWLAMPMTNGGVWDKRPPAPVLPAGLIRTSANTYRRAQMHLLSRPAHLEGRLLQQLAAEIAIADPVEADRLRAQQIGYLAGYGRLGQAQAQLRDLRARYEAAPHAVVGPWIIFADSLVDRAAAQHDSSLLKMRRAHALSRISNVSGLHALSAAWLTHLYWNLQHVDTSVSYAIEAFGACIPCDKAALIRLSLVIGEALILSRREDAGQRWYRQARQLSLQIGDVPSLSALTYNLTSVRLMLLRQDVLSGSGLVATGFVGAKMSQNFDEAMGVTSDARTLLQQARILSLQGDARAALNLFVAHGKAVVLEGTRIRSEWLSDEAWCQARLGEIQSAIDTAEAARQAIVKDTQIDDLASVCSRLARTYRLVGDSTKAADYQRQSELLWDKYRVMQEDFGARFDAIYHSTETVID